MKKILTIAIIGLMFGAIFGITLHQTSVQIKNQAPIIAQALNFLSPAIAHADSDTIGGIKPPPLPPPPIW